MPGVCNHEFFWPLKAADGHYYQVCRFCGVQCEYDWTEMRRVDGDSATALVSGRFNPNVIVCLEAPTSLNLLIEMEPRYRVFLRNLVDVLRPKPAGSTTFWSMAFWREAFFNSGVSWRHFGESLVAHMIALAVVLVLSQTSWVSQDMPRRRNRFENYHLSYYKPAGTFPALRGNPSRVRPFRKQDAGPRGTPLRVAAEHPQTATAAPSLSAPNLQLNSPPQPRIAAANPVLPAMPLASTGHSRSTLTVGGVAVVAPPPEVGQVAQGSARRLGLPQASVVAPAPMPGVVSSRPAMAAPGTSVVGPAPVLQASLRNLGDMNMGSATVVAPSPHLSVAEQRAIPGGLQGTLGGGSALVVPPPPSAPRSGALAGGRAGLLSGGGLQVVPPPPSVRGVEDAAGSTGGSGRVSALSGVGQQVVPPAPSMQGTSGSSSDRREGPLSGAGVSAGLQGVAPAPAIGSGGSSGGAGRQMAMNLAPALAPASPSPVIKNAQPPAAEKPPEPATEEMPLRLIGLAMALPSSSYFSNYEVFIAERKLSKGLAQLIKLVYVSLPYQRRLSEYGVDNTKIYKLRVSRDRSCDESLMQMTWPETDPHPDAKNVADAPALSAADRKGMLPCYRTTADDYRKALARSH